MKELSVIIPTYNEEMRLPATLTKVVNFLADQKTNNEIIISDGASTDKTVDFVHNFLSRIPIKLIRQKRREGKGAGVKEGMLEARGDWILFMDADNSTAILQLKKLAKYRKEFDVIIGSRYARVEARVKQSFVRRFISRLGSRLIKMITGLKINDTQCGFKLFSRAAAKKIFHALETKGWGFDVEVLLLAQKFGYKIKEVPVVWRDAEGTHLRAIQDSFKTLGEIWRIKRRLGR